MGFPSRLSFHARHRDGPHRRHDPRKAPSEPRRRGRIVAAGLIWLLAGAAFAAPLRIATYTVELSRKGPALLLQAITAGKDAQVAASIAVIARVNPDVILLTGFDWDYGQAALSAYADRLAQAGAVYPYRYAPRPNTGMPTGLDLDGDGRLGGPGDAQGFGAFAGQGGMAILSRLPVDAAASRDLSAVLWRDLPGAGFDAAMPPPGARDILRLAETGAWDVVLTRPNGRPLHLLAFAASPPLFDGPEDRNGQRNHDQIAFWQVLLAGRLPMPPPIGPFVLLGDANLDPDDGEGRHEAIRALLADPRLTDPAPTSTGAYEAALLPLNAGHVGDPGRPTVLWDRPGQPGSLRVDYVLPSADLTVTGAGVFWPAQGEAGAADATTASRHRLVWVDLDLP
ncbi:MAG: endonuclease/exonuclease/phosphatase family protein [Rhodobacteraceae bacterium]|nr:endonuclease/exonuclease/phosphatase family protein [Paracoccaceae bacterium]